MPIRAALNGHFLLVLVGVTSVALDVLTVTISSFSVNRYAFRLHLMPSYAIASRAKAVANAEIIAKSSSSEVDQASTIPTKTRHASPSSLQSSYP